MIETRNHRFSTERLLVNEWHSFAPDEWPQLNLDSIVQGLLTERVTKNLPPLWQGPYNLSRARQWIKERDREGVTLLALEKANERAIGVIILFESDASGHLRLGYLLNESAWGKGFASELVGGFVSWCRHHDIHSLTGGVERSNVASRRVLEKCGFVAESETDETVEQLFSIEFL